MPYPIGFDPDPLFLLKRGFVGIALLIGVQVIFVIMMFAIADIIGGTLEKTSVVTVSGFICYASVIIYLLVSYQHQQPAFFSSIGLRLRESLTLWVALPFLMFIANNMLSNAVLELFFNAETVNQALQSQRDELVPAPSASSSGSPFILVLNFIVIALIGPVVEEVLFRGLLLQGLIKRFGGSIFGKTLAVIASSALFAAIHFDLTLAPFLFILGMLAALATLYTRSLKPAIIFHMINNTSALINGYLF